MIGRRTDSGEKYGASFLELFFDLVFVFAITQVSHLLLDHLTWVGLGQSTIALLVVWWAWNYTTWVTNSLDIVAGPVFYLAAQIALRWRMTGGLSRRRVVAVAICAVVGVIGWLGTAAMLVGGLLVAVLVAVAVTDELAGRSRKRESAEATA